MWLLLGNNHLGQNTYLHSTCSLFAQFLPTSQRARATGLSALEGHFRFSRLRPHSTFADLYFNVIWYLFLISPSDLWDIIYILFSFITICQNQSQRRCSMNICRIKLLQLWDPEELVSIWYYKKMETIEMYMIRPYIDSPNNHKYIPWVMT